MCGIWAILGSEYVPAKHQREFMRIVGRGPDLTVVQRVAAKLWLGFHRLSIVQPGDSPSGQPIFADGLAVVCNGEIYNHMELKEMSPMDNTRVRNGGSDCAAILHAFVASGRDLRRCCASLDGVFAFAMADRHFLYVARDPLGVRPLFYGFASNQTMFIGSELKSIEKLCKRVFFFPPGCCAKIPLQSPVDFLDIQPYWTLPTAIDRSIGVLEAQATIRKLLTDAVEKRLMGNRQFGFMLSGGLDSSLVAALASRRLMAEDDGHHCLPVAFSVGFADSPDLENARHVARFLGIPHRILVISTQDCLDIVPEVVFALETYDPLVVRCGIPHFLLCRHIAASSDVKVLLSGEGADELFGSYAYMQRAPSSLFLHQEMIRRLLLLHQYDVLRCDRCTSCHGLEIRVPFLDKKFVSFVARVAPSLKLIANKTEKWLLRSAFQDMLPKEVLWRSKEGFSEALGKMDLGELLEQSATLHISDEQFADREQLFPWNTPQTKEEFWYRSLFEQRFDIKKLAKELIHTKVYRTAAWQVPSLEEQSESSGDESKENKPASRVSKDAENFLGYELLNDSIEMRKRIRRRSTGSAKLDGIA